MQADAPRDFRWDGAPRPDPVTGRVPLAPTPRAADALATLAEAENFCADWERATLRLALVADLAHVVRALLGRCASRETELQAIIREERAEHAATVARLRQEHADRTAELVARNEALLRHVVQAESARAPAPVVLPMPPSDE